jgi:4-amino-4-deoxy-L-arabinose transferase-like glycosyltransferase
MALAMLVVISTLLKLTAASPTWLHYDENYYLDISRNFIARGELTPYMWRLGDTNIIAGSGSGYGILALTLWMQAVGVSLWNGRLLMIVFGVLTALTLYFAARKWWGSNAAGIAAAVFALVATSPFYTLTMRMDAIGMLAYALVLLLYAHAMRGQWRWLHVAVGVAAVAAAEFHILALLYLGGLAFSYGVTYAAAVVRERRLRLDAPAVYFGIGALLAGILYIVIHVLPDPRAYFIISEQCHDCSGRALMKEIERFAGYAVLRLPELLLLMTSVGAALMRRGKADGHYLLLLVGFLITQFVISPPAFSHYTQHIWLLVAMGVAGLVAHGFRRAGALRRWRVYAGAVVSFGFLALNWAYHVNQAEPYELRMTIAPSAAIDFVRAHIPSETVVMADVAAYYDLQEYPNFLSYRNGDIYGNALRGETQLAFWQRIQPRVIVGGWGADDPELQTYMSMMDFMSPVPGLWVAGDLRQQINLPSIRSVGEG